MNCEYCNAYNDKEEHRCTRCGRPMIDAVSARRPEMFPVQAGAAAPAIAPQAAPSSIRPTTLSAPQLVTELAKPGERQDYAYQASLFGPQEVSRRASQAMKRNVPVPPRVKREAIVQERLDFDAAIPEGARTLPTSVEAAVYCNAPVAIPTHRILAAALDTAIILMALGVFLATFYFAGLEIVLTKETIPLYGAVGALIALFYRTIFCIGNADTFGVQWAGLRLLNFDGRLPTRKERVCRTAGACVSVIATGIGFAWALCDEERLTWHDYISKTFPSPRSL